MKINQTNIMHIKNWDENKIQSKIIKINFKNFMKKEMFL
jgi:hypothetical protein